MTHWTQVPANVSTVEFLLLGGVTLVPWLRHRLRRARWAAALSVDIVTNPGWGPAAGRVVRRPVP